MISYRKLAEHDREVARTLRDRGRQQEAKTWDYSASLWEQELDKSKKGGKQNA